MVGVPVAKKHFAYAEAYVAFLADMRSGQIGYRILLRVEEMPMPGDIAVVHDVPRAVEADLERVLNLRFLQQPIG